MIEVRLALVIAKPDADAIDVAIVRHVIEPCRCGANLAGGETTCAMCGRYALATLLEAAEDWYAPERDELLRSFRGVDDAL